jgi:superkiller protein 3
MIKNAMTRTLTSLVLASLLFFGCAVSKPAEPHEETAKSEPEDPEAYYSTGVDYYLKQDYDKAIEYFGKAVELKPDYADAYYNIGVAYGKKQDHDKALEAYKKAIKLRVDKAIAYYQIGNVHTEKQEHDKAAEIF